MIYSRVFIIVARGNSEFKSFLLKINSGFARNVPLMNCNSSRVLGINYHLHSILAFDESGAMRMPLMCKSTNRGEERERDS